MRRVPGAPVADNGSMPLNPSSFRRLDASTAAQWAVIMADPGNTEVSRADRMLDRLRLLQDNVEGFAIDELTHSRQCAARAEGDGAADDLVLAALFHDIGHLFGDDNHGAVAAELLRPHVRAEVVEVVRFHTDFTSRHYAAVLGGDPDRREQHRGQGWFELGAQFADDWDQRSFDPDYPTPPLAHFEPLVHDLVRGG